MRGAVANPPSETVPDEPGGKAPAPDQLRLVQLFVNSLDIEGGIEELGSPGELGSWLYRHGLTATREAFTKRDVERARSFRELLRGMALANAGVVMSPRLVGQLDRELRRLRFALVGDPTEELSLRGSQPGLDGAL